MSASIDFSTPCLTLDLSGPQPQVTFGGHVVPGVSKAELIVEAGELPVLVLTLNTFNLPDALMWPGTKPKRGETS